MTPKRSPRLPQGAPTGKKVLQAFPRPADAPKVKQTAKTGHFTGKVRLKGEALELLRHQVFVRNNGNCENCGIWAGWFYGHMHHKRHRSLGGSDSLENCEWLCPECHGGKHNQ